jgi:hypothetical protein
MADNKWEQPDAPPPPLFLNKKERDLVKQVNDELVERIIGQQLLYYAIDIKNTNFHPLYGEAIEKTFLPPVRVFALVDWEGIKTETDKYGLDVTTSLTIHFHKRRLTEDQNIFVREGDFVLYSDFYYEVLTLNEPTQLFGQADQRFEISAKCVRARKGLFDAT